MSARLFGVRRLALHRMVHGLPPLSTRQSLLWRAALGSLIAELLIVGKREQAPALQNGNSGMCVPFNFLKIKALFAFNTLK
jgi:hypothetical protein